MKLLLENWRQYINEGMASIDSLDPELEITIQTYPDGDEVDIYFSEVEYPGEPGYGEPSGTVTLDLVSNVLPKFRGLRSQYCTADKKLWQMHVQARITHGWGPILYDIAMEWAATNGDGLIADRNSVSSEAWDVWDYYLQNRKDVQPHQLDDLENTLTPEDPDNCDQEVAADPGEKQDLLDSPISKYYTKAPTLINTYKGTRIKMI